MSPPRRRPRRRRVHRSTTTRRRRLPSTGSSAARRARSGYGNQPLEPTVEDGVKVFELTIEEIDHRIDAQKDPVKALGFNGTWPGPRLTVIEGDTVRATSRTTCTSRPASTSTARGCRTRWTACRTSPRSRSSRARASPTSSRRERPGRTCTTRTTTRPTRSGVASSGAFIVEPEGPGPALRPPLRRDPGHRLDQQRRAGRVHDQRPRLPGDGADRRQASATRSSSGS